jgi:gamma-glutamyl hercynylcysteine S-oxide hydrolase
MCRLAAYVGPAIPIAAMLYEAPWSLELQSYRPRHQLSGYVNADGTGVAWWDGESAQPLRYVTERPPWSDANLPGLSRRLRGVVQLAALRSATPGVPFGPSAVAPFVHSGVAAAHNGYLRAFREKTGRVLLSRLPDGLFAAMDAVSDSQVLFLTALRHLERDPGAGLAGALRGAVLEAGEVCAKAGVPASLNLVLADSTKVVAARAAQGTASNSLYTLRGGARWPGACLLASEPLDEDPLWMPVPDGHLVEITAVGVRCAPLAELEGNG